ncbi:ATP-binding cassette domain-containing protein [Thermoflexus sp.]|uniref:ATP-binding cassette domain-containing protein n=1 Tax=Thermoflexus sp. TaxID=1969742 RepID=UPI0025D4ED1B|nr:ATP-binding cassette domain-containing protein [Thermoflexus sp.]MDW8180549.1 ATP-binding cassette domain-containing protein [Anaerolineae bacterium]MCS6964849.1 ATP-binding cassette domain-containing protein [Thermoflexus sp.]MCS7351096.1 ATP-binding cassette domain-containing protein [Thermoflexus sp.]MCX7690510.1 ATP-binding cassette domain-containing protein [Thermoflexus sp.]MDW8184477.1 ATP-binding cassette domain-containing protein [Anaerolineae bacterium]
MIRAEGLRKVFETVVAVEEVNLEVRPGEIVALLGPNGAGKTTTLRMLAALLRPTAGRAIVAGYDTVREPQEVRRRVGLLAELPGLYLRMTGEEYLAFFADIYEIPRPLFWKRTEEWLDRLDLRAALPQRIAAYSKGMRQKLALLRAFLHRPPVLLLDEPTSAMDPESAQVAREMIRSFAENGHAVLLCTHNLYEAEALADRIAVLHRGRIRVEGSPQALRERFMGPPLYELRLAVPVEEAWGALPQGLPIVAHGPNWIRYRAQDPERENPQILAAVITQGIPVVSLTEVPRPLETVYLQILSGGFLRDTEGMPVEREDHSAGAGVRIPPGSSSNPSLPEANRRCTTNTRRIQRAPAGLRDFQRWIRGTWGVFRRDIVDILRDWRLITPLALLLLVFPVLSMLSAEAATRYVAQFGAQLISERLLPFLALATGFLPLTVCLIIPLETFVGEKERRTMEPLLAAPLSDLQLYMGKGLAALLIPTLISLLGVTVYFVILILRGAWIFDLATVLSMYSILIMHAVVMVAGAIVISTQSTSVRGANLLASFIILPVSVLLIFESSLLFWGSYRTLAIVLCILLVYAILLVRMGIALFNREQLLSAEFDTLDLRGILRGFWRALRHGDPVQPISSRWDHLRQPIQRSIGALGTLAALGLMGLGIAWLWLPPIVLSPDAIFHHLSASGLPSLRALEGTDWLPFTPWGIFFHNLRALVINTLIGVITLGLWTALYPVGLMGLIGLLLRTLFTSDLRLGIAGLLAILPHGILELPAAGLVLAGALRLGLTLLTPPGPRSLRDRLVLAWADWLKLLLIATPLLLLAAWIEVHVTPHLVLWWLAGISR